MLFSFVHTDIYMDDVNGQQAVNDLADFLFQEQEFLDDIADVVLNKRTLFDFEMWRITYLKNKSKSKRKEKVRKEFARLLAAVYDLTRLPPPGEKEIDYLRRLRGGILEVLVSHFLVARYPFMGCNCHIYIDNCALKGSKGNPKTVDVVGVDKLQDPEKGEIYECKVGSFHIEEYHLEFIQNTRSYFTQKGISTIIAAVISFEHEIILKSAFKKLGYPSQEMISREHLKSLISYDKAKALLLVV